MNNVDMVEVQALADGDPHVAGWIAGLIMSGQESGEIRATLTTVREYLASRFEEAEAGDGGACLNALWVCLAMSNYPVPDWLRKRLSGAIGEWREFQRSFEDALGVPKLTHRNAKRRWHLLPSLIWQLVEERKKQGEPMDDENMFEPVKDRVNELCEGMGEAELKLECRTVKEMYYGMRKRMGDE